MSTETSIGSSPGLGGNEDHGNADGCGNKTLGEHAGQQAPAGAERVEGQGAQPAAEGGLIEEAGAQVPAGVPGARPRPGVKKGAEAYPDGPNVEDSPWELDAARGKLPKDR
jgi:hypothetical protein